MTSYETRIEDTRQKITEIMAEIRNLNKGEIYMTGKEENGISWIDGTDDGRDLMAILDDCEALQQELENIKSKAIEELTTKMEETGQTQFRSYREGKSHTYIYKPAGTSIRFDLEGLKRDLPDIYEKYHNKQTSRKATVQILTSDWQTIDEWASQTAPQVSAGSATAISSQSQGKSYNAIQNPVNVSHAADRGTYIHQMAQEMAWNGWQIPDRVIPTGTSWLALDYLREIMQGSETLQTEQPGHWHTYNGKIDWLGIRNGRRVLVDWKTEEKQDIDSWTTQLNAYAWMLRNRGEVVEELAVVWLPLKGSGQLVTIEQLTEAETLQRLQTSRP